MVEVGGWEHECCGPSIERNRVVDLGCLRVMGPDGEVHLSETHHHLEPELQVQGRVRDIQVVRPGHPCQPVLRLPSGEAMRGFDADDDGHLEAPWTGQLLPDGDDFLVTVHVSS